MFSLFRHLRQKKKNRERILALDLLRGAFLIEIVVNHIAWKPSLLTFVGGGGMLFASAAEGFFTISGLLVGYLYAPRVLKETKKIFTKIWKRALLLYALATFFTIFYTAWALLDPHNAVYQTIYNPTRAPWRFLVDTFTMRYAFGWAEFLNRYAMFMFFAPFVVWLIAKGRAWIIALVSFFIWLFLRETDRFLPFSAWQLVFTYGIILGYYLPHIEEWFHHLKRTVKRSIFVGVVSVALISYTFSMLLLVVAPLVLSPHSQIIQLHNQLIPYFDKDHVAPARVAIGVVWFAALYMTFRKFEKPISQYTYGVLEVFGRQSLFVYSLHAFLLFIVDLYLTPAPGHTLWQNTLVTLAVLVIIYIAAYNRVHITEYSKKFFRNRSTTQIP